MSDEKNGVSGVARNRQNLKPWGRRDPNGYIARLYMLVKDMPGGTTKTYAKHLRTTPAVASRAMHDLRVRGFVQRTKQSDCWVYTVVPGDAIPAEWAPAMTAMATTTAVATQPSDKDTPMWVIYNLLRERPGLTSAEVSYALKDHPHFAQRRAGSWLTYMCRHGAARVEGHVRGRKRYYPGDVEPPPWRGRVGRRKREHGAAAAEARARYSALSTPAGQKRTSAGQPDANSLNARLYALVREAPGHEAVYYADALGCSRDVASRTMSRLHARKLVVRRPGPWRWLYSVNLGVQPPQAWNVDSNTVRESVKSAVAALGQDSPRWVIYKLLLASPGLTHAEISYALKDCPYFTRSTAGSRLTGMVQAGYARVEGSAYDSRRYFVGDKEPPTRRGAWRAACQDANRVLVAPTPAQPAPETRVVRTSAGTAAVLPSLVEQVRADIAKIDEQLAKYNDLVRQRDRLQKALAALQET